MNLVVSLKIDFNMLKKLFIFLIKYIPVMQMAGILVNNILYCCSLFDNYTIIFDFILGNSVLCSILFYICSYIFRFCAWHRLIITANLINTFIVLLDYIFVFDISNLSSILIYFTIDLLFLLLILIYKFKCQN